MKPERIHWIDWSKCILIYLVVLAHYGGIPAFVDNFICAFHMPAFFMISGYLHKSQPVAVSFSKNIKRLLIPALLFSALCLMHTIVIDIVKHVPLSMEEHVYKPVLGLVRYDRPNAMPQCGVIWFIEVLFLSKLIIDALQYFRNKYLLPFIIVIFAIFTGIIYQYNLNDNSWWFLIQRTFASFPFVALGFLAKKYGWMEQISKTNWLPIAIGACYVAGVIYNGRVGIASWRFGHSVTMYFIIAVMGCVAFFQMAGKLRRGGILLETISNGTIVILCLHRLMIPYMNKIGIEPFIGSLVILCICYPIILFFNRYAPWFVGRQQIKK